MDLLYIYMCKFTAVRLVCVGEKAQILHTWKIQA